MNPFTPGFGTKPRVLAGRDEVLELFKEALDSESPHPSDAILLSGQRGVGKTVMLDELGDTARAAGWFVIDVTADGESEWLDELATTVASEIRERDPEGRTITGVSVLHGLFSIDFADKPKDTWTPKLRELLTALAKTCTDTSSPHTGTGIMITLDEIQTANLEQVRKFGKVFQHLANREGMPIKFACAGLPAIDDALLRDKTKSTFLSRLDRNDLSRLSENESRHVLEQTARIGKVEITAAAMDIAISTANGSPYLVQLIGFHSWRAAEKQQQPITEIKRAHVEAGTEVSKRKFVSDVTALAWRDLTTVERSFVLAMAIDNGPSKTADIAQRFNKGQNYISPYRSALIKADIVYATRTGYVDFVAPGFRDFLRTQEEFAEYKRLLEPDATN